MMKYQLTDDGFGESTAPVTLADLQETFPALDFVESYQWGADVVIVRFSDSPGDWHIVAVAVGQEMK